MFACSSRFLIPFCLLNVSYFRFICKTAHSASPLLYERRSNSQAGVNNTFFLMCPNSDAGSKKTLISGFLMPSVCGKGKQEHSVAKVVQVVWLVLAQCTHRHKKNSTQKVKRSPTTSPLAEAKKALVTVKWCWDAVAPVLMLLSFSTSHWAC